MRVLLLIVALTIVSCEPPPRVMALGDSLTLGSPSYVPSESYRAGVDAHVWQRIQWVGPELGPGQTRAHNGVSGHFLGEIRLEALAHHTEYRPEVYVLNGGTNDLLFGNGPKKIAAVMRRTLTTVTELPGVEAVILLDVPVQPADFEDSRLYNVELAQLAKDFEPVMFAPCFGDVELADGVHPTEFGYWSAGECLAPYVAKVIR